MSIKYLLLTAILSPLVGALLLSFSQKVHTKIVNTISIITMSITLILLIYTTSFAGALNSFDNMAVLHWLSFGGFTINFSFIFNVVNQKMTILVAFISLMVQIYSIGYLKNHHNQTEPSNNYRFFGLINFFTFAMLLFVVADDLITTYFGWELISISSYFLIGYWFKKESANNASLMAIITNRFGDIALLIGFCILIALTGEVEIGKINYVLLSITTSWMVFGENVSAIGFAITLIIIGVITKSAQFPLHFWLPSAMKAPTPVSALIHSATMVCAGVFLVIKLNQVFVFTPLAYSFFSYFGGFFAIIFTIFAIAQNDIKKILAYATIAQLAVMFVFLGVLPNTSAMELTVAMEHLTFHSIYKVLLFMIAGILILTHQGEQNIHKFTGVYKNSPGLFLFLCIGVLPLLSTSLTSPSFSTISIVSFLSAILGARLLLVLGFNNPPNNNVPNQSITIKLVNQKSFYIPIIILSIFSLMYNFMVFPLLHDISHNSRTYTEFNLQFINTLSFWSAVIGVTVAWLIYYKYPHALDRLKTKKCFSNVNHALQNSFYIESTLGKIIKNFKLLSELVNEFFEKYLINGSNNNIKKLANYLAKLVAKSQNGSTSQYTLTMIVIMSFALICFMVIS